MKLTKRVFNILSKYGWPAMLIIFTCFALGFTWASSDEMYSEIRLFDKVALMVNQNYVDEIDEEKLIKVAIDNMLAELDDYTKYLDTADYLKLSQETDGRYNGIGIGLDYIDDSLFVVSVLEGTSGELAGLTPGDCVIKIDTVSTLGLDLHDIRPLTSGPAGSKIDLTIYHYDGQINEISVTLESIEIDPIPYFALIDDNIGYIRLSRFSEECSDELTEIVFLLKEDGMQSMILDLRDNPGGLLLEAVKVAAVFLPENSPVVETRGRGDELINEYLSQTKPVFPDGELIILVNQNTASAAEIVAGAIQDHDRGIILGVDSYGKGLVQQVLQFSENSALKITTSKYYLPSGRSLQMRDSPDVNASDSIYATDQGRPVYSGCGITPDIRVGETEVPDIIAYLKDEMIFFKFALQYRNNNQIEDGFEISEDVFNEFRNYLSVNRFDSHSKLNDAVRLIEDEINDQNYSVNNALSILESAVRNEFYDDVDNHKAEISLNIKQAIFSQTFGEYAVYERVWLTDHPEITKAIELLTEKDEYFTILVSY